MDSDADKFAAIAQKYIGASEPLTRLGWGISGYVYLTPDLRSAIKAHRYGQGFHAEVRTYQMLRRLGMRNLLGFTIHDCLIIAPICWRFGWTS